MIGVGGDIYDQSMSEDASAVSLRCGHLEVVFGTEVGISAFQMTASGDQTAVDPTDLRGAAHRLIEIAPLLDYTATDVVFVADGYSDVEIAATTPTVTLRKFGAGGATLTVAIEKSNDDARKGLLAEAAYAARRQRLADAADVVAPLTNEDADVVGRLDVPGSPLLTELRADRRRAFKSPSFLTQTGGDLECAITNIVSDLRAAVRFGAAGLADTTDDLLDESIQLACVQGGWADRVRLLIAAEEIWAIERLARIGSRLSAHPNEDFDQLLAEYEAQHQLAIDLAVLFKEVIDRIPSAPTNPVVRLVRGKEIRDALALRETLAAYSAAVTTPAVSNRDTITWDDAAKSLMAVDLVTDDDADERLRSDMSPPSADDAAAALGGLFEAQLPAARAIVDDLDHQHPDVDAEGRVQIVKRQAVRKLSAGARYADAAPPLQEVVAELAMCIALLRGFEPRTEAEFEELGRRILSRADKIANLQAQASNALPVAVAGLSRLLKVVQPIVMEAVFRQLGGIKPTSAGAARDAYKTMRSKVWRARHDRGVTAAAAGGGANVLLKAVDSAAPRLIVRYVDQALSSPKPKR
ncbi:hypothetical protein TL10_01690 [Mycolicibacterium llatzerense]|uniref:Uncharacterized protein n=2 Tax=Mycolicibacterium llatzerense TaxID=280871 RepID=A0A0D1LJ96_9MYCO|nr:hypothetical protein TL10_01690 [Mycolicibacterium llatzerense]